MLSMMMSCSPSEILFSKVSIPQMGRDSGSGPNVTCLRISSNLACFFWNRTLKACSRGVLLRRVTNEERGSIQLTQDSLEMMIKKGERYPSQLRIEIATPTWWDRSGSKNNHHDNQRGTHNEN